MKISRTNVTTHSAFKSMICYADRTSDYFGVDFYWNVRVAPVGINHQGLRPLFLEDDFGFHILPKMSESDMDEYRYSCFEQGVRFSGCYITAFSDTDQDCFWSLSLNSFDEFAGA